MSFCSMSVNLSPALGTVGGVAAMAGDGMSAYMGEPSVTNKATMTAAAAAALSWAADNYSKAHPLLKGLGAGVGHAAAATQIGSSLVAINNAQNATQVAAGAFGVIAGVSSFISSSLTAFASKQACPRRTVYCRNCCATGVSKRSDHQ